MKQILIIGFGLSGRSAAKWALSINASVFAVDARAEELKNHPDVQALLLQGVRIINEKALDALDFSYAVCSPGIADNHPLIQKLIKKGIPVLGEVELAFAHLNHPILGVTGTNGKTTVTKLIEHILNFSGKKAHAFGNVGVPLTAAIDSIPSNEILVVELSSYQLESLKGPILDASCLLNITPDHLDRYGTMENYTAAKMNIVSVTKDQKKCFIEEKIKKPIDVSGFGYSSKLSLYTDLIGVYNEFGKLSNLPQVLQNKKSHDLENFMAAFALCMSVGVRPELISDAYSSFKKPEHRIEFVKEIRGVKFFDDSKGTNIDAVMRAIEMMEGQVHLIAGGVDKGASYVPWKVFQKQIKGVFAIGQAAKKIKEDLAPEISVTIFKSLNDAVKSAFEGACPGDNILLSPGCSSFDMFIDYIDRGKTFQKIVHNEMV